jgi:uncharacterized cupredoxin-like copper-binding protein
MRRFVVVFFACLAVVGTAVAGFSFAGTLAPKAAGVTTNVTVHMGEFYFALDKDTAPVGTVVFTVINDGDVQHDFAIAGQTTPLVNKGETVTLTVNFTDAKDYSYLCNVGEHAIYGMQGFFHVTGGPAPTTTATTTAPPPPPATAIGVSATEFKYTLTGAKATVNKVYKNVKVRYRVKRNGKFIKVNGKYVWRTKTVRKLVKTTTTYSVPAGPVKFTVTNNGTVPHNFVIGSDQTLVLAPGKSQVLSTTLTPKTYTYICSIVGHAEAGMKGTLVAT